MPIPTLDNKNNFKQYLRYFRNKFDSQIQQIELSHLEAIMPTRDQTIPSNTNINLVLFDNKEVVDLSIPLNNTGYIYFPAVEGDEINILWENEIYTIGFSQGFQSLKFKGTDYSLNQSFTIGSRVLKVKGLGGGLVEVSNAPTYTLTQDTTLVDEGQTVTFTVTTTDVSDGTNISFQVVGGPNFNNEDIETTSYASTPDMSGSVAVNNNSAVIDIDIRADYSSSEIQEYFTLKIFDFAGNTVATSPTIFFNDTSNAVYSIGVNPTYNEGDTVNVLVSTTGVPDGVQFYWDIPETTVDAYDILSLSGTVTINQGVGSFDVVTKGDFNTETGETFVINLRNYSSTSSIVATSSTINLVDVPYTITMVPDKTTIVESTKDSQSDLIITVTTSGVANGTLYPGAWINGSYDTDDVSPPAGIVYPPPPEFPSSIVVENNQASFTVNIVRDAKTEGTEVLTIILKNDDNVIVATSPDINIVDTSFIGSRHNGRTFGPIQINREDDSSAWHPYQVPIGDWYTYCDLDKVPNNSKIAIFIDTSGSMTMGTVQGAYDLMTQKLTARGITYITIQNNDEDWITPFDIPLD